MSSGARTLLGRNTSLASRQAVYETADGVEVESTEQYELSRRRVLFEDVLLVTYHRETGWPVVVANIFVFLVFFMIGGSIIAANGSVPAALIVAAFGVPSLLLILVRLTLKVDVVTLFGRRSKAAIRFPFRKQRARETYGHLCARARQIQDQIASENRGFEATPAEEPPPPPPGPILTTVNLP